MKAIALAGVMVFLCAATSGAALFAVLDQISLNAGNVDVGVESPPMNITCDVRSTDSAEWELSLQAGLLTHTSGSATIKGQFFRYWLGGDYPGTETPLFGVDAPVPQSMTTIYRADPSEYLTSSSVVRIGFKIIVDPAQTVGTYTTTITLTLVNAL